MAEQGLKKQGLIICTFLKVPVNSSFLQRIFNVLKAWLAMLHAIILSNVKTKNKT